MAPIAMEMFAATAERSHHSKVQYLFSHSTVKVLLGPLQAHGQCHLDDAKFTIVTSFSASTSAHLLIQMLKSGS